MAKLRERIEELELYSKQYNGSYTQIIWDDEILGAILNLLKEEVDKLTEKRIDSHSYNNPADVELGIAEQYWHTKDELMEVFNG